MSKYQFGSRWTRLDRILLNRLGLSVEEIEKRIQDLVAEGQLTPEQYATLIQSVNGLISKGHVKPNDLSPELLELINNSDGTPFNILSIPRDNSVDVSKVEFIEKSSNILNTFTITPNHSIDAATGDLRVVIDSNATTDYIKIDPNAEYTLKHIGRYAFYDGNKNFISGSSRGISPDNLAEPTTIMTEDNYQYGRFVFDGNVVEDAQINKGSTLLNYEPFYTPKLKKDAFDFEIGLDNLDFIKKTTNIIDLSDSVTNAEIRSNGNLLSRNGQMVTKHLRIKEGRYYTFTKVGRYSFYDSEGNFQSGFYRGYEGDSRYETNTIQAPPNSDTIRLQFFIDDKDSVQMNEGRELLPYEPFHPNTLVDVVTEHSISDDSNNKKDLSDKDYYLVDMEVTEEYTAPEQKFDEGFNWVQFRTDEIYAMYDDLMVKYPDYISKTLLGHEETGLPIYRYDFKPARPGNVETKFPKVIVNTGTHFERTAVWVAAKSFGEICNNWESDKALEFLRWNVHWVVVPVVNPWGINNSSRKNSNKVDINRNFPSNWESGGSTDIDSTTYKGPAPLSEISSQILLSVMEEEKDALFHIDFHNFSSTDNFLWTAAGSIFTLNIGKTHIARMSRKWRREYSFLPQDDTMFGYANLNPGGTIAIHSEEIGTRASVYEMSAEMGWEINPEPNSMFTQTLGVESWINYLVMMLKYTIKEANSL